MKTANQNAKQAKVPSVEVGKNVHREYDEKCHIILMS